MFKLGFLIAGLWIAGTAYLLFHSVSRLLFDEPSASSRTVMFIGRLGASMSWPLMLLAPSGRRTLRKIMKG